MNFMLFGCAFYAPVRERFAMFENFGGAAQQWEYSSYCRPECDHMSQFMHRNPDLLSASVHACYPKSAIPDTDPDIVLSRPDIAAVINDADEFHSCVSEGSITDEEWFDADQS